MTTIWLSGDREEFAGWRKLEFCSGWQERSHAADHRGSLGGTSCFLFTLFAVFTVFTFFAFCTFFAFFPSRSLADTIKAVFEIEGIEFRSDKRRGFNAVDFGMNARKNGSLVTAILALTLAFVFSVQAQENKGAGQRTLEQCQQAWTELSADFKKVEERIGAGGDDAAAARREFTQLASKAKALVKELEVAAKAELEKDRSSSAALRALMGRALQAAGKDEDWKTLKLGDYLIQKGISPKYFEVAAKTESLTIKQKQVFDELLIRQAEALKNDLPRVELKTTKGTLVVELFENEAPGTVGNFVFLVENGYFNDMLFHRVIEGFMAQSGGFKLDTDGEQRGGEGPGYEIKCECYEPNARKHFTGALSMAKKPGERDSGGSEFFVTLERTDFLDGEHTVFGRVLSGYELFENLERTHLNDQYGREEEIEGVLKDKILSAKVIRKRGHKYKPARVKEDEASADEQTPDVETPPADAEAADGGPGLSSPG